MRDARRLRHDAKLPKARTVAPGRFNQGSDLVIAHDAFGDLDRVVSSGKPAHGVTDAQDGPTDIAVDPKDGGTDAKRARQNDADDQPKRHAPDPPRLIEGSQALRLVNG